MRPDLVCFVKRSDVVAQGVEDGLCAVAQVELVEDVGDVAANGGQTDD